MPYASPQWFVKIGPFPERPRTESIELWPEELPDDYSTPPPYRSFAGNSTTGPLMPESIPVTVRSPLSSNPTGLDRRGYGAHCGGLLRCTDCHRRRSRRYHALNVLDPKRFPNSGICSRCTPVRQCAAELE